MRAGTAVATTLKPGATTGRGAAARGYRAFGETLVRIDLVERIARATHDLRQARVPFLPDTVLATSFGIDAAAYAAILRALGFRSSADGQWTWGSRPKAAPVLRPVKPNAFSALGDLLLG